jgi:hypothetical protein
VLANAAALARGETLYADRITFVAPLTFELLALLLRGFGSHLLVGRLLQLAVFAACTALVFAILLRTAGRRAAVLGALALLALKPLGFVLWTIASYSQLAQLFCLAAVWLLLRFFAEGRARWLGAAGAALGLTLLTKQNLGLWMGIAAGLALAADALYARSPGRGAWLRRGAWLLAGAGAPLALASAHYAAQGSLPGLFQYAVLDLFHLQGAYAIAPPPLAPWFSRPDLPMLALPYIPPPLLAFAFERKGAAASPALRLALELLVKGAYYLPLLALAALLAALGRGAAARMPRAQWSSLVLLAGFAGTSYASMLYRADWMHLMNVYPALLIACAWAGARLGARSRAAAAFAGALCALWLAAGAAVAAALLAGSSAALETARGRLVDWQPVVEDVEPVVRYLEARPAGERIAVLPASPLLYFLSGRRMPLAHDLFMPGLIGPRADRRTAGELAEVEQVVFDAKPLPFVYSSLPEYAPETSAVLALDFEVERILSSTSYLLRRRAGGAERTVVDVWDRLGERGVPLGPGATFPPRASGPPRVERTSWSFHRVIALPVSLQQPRSCVRFEHLPASPERLSFLPAFDPRAWIGRRAGGSAVFEVRLRRAGASSFESLYREERAVGPPGTSAQLPLARFAGEAVELELCAATASLRPRAGVTRAGFASVRVVAPEAPSGPD